MGMDNSKEDIVIPELYNLALSSGLMPDISIDESILKYSGLNSSDVLMSYTSQLRSAVLGKVPSYAASLGSSIASLNSVPNAVGLGALIISLILDLAIMSVTRGSDSSTLNMLRRVFAEEKALSVRDTMDECMKRVSMHVRDRSKVLEEIERIEKQLSEQLTRLRNSMLHDEQMSSRSMKYWVNGAAFHSQMLIHAGRLKADINGAASENYVASINTVVEHYQNDLHELLEKYKTYKRSSITIYLEWSYRQTYDIYYCNSVIKDYELDRTAKKWRPNNICKVSVDTYVNYMFDTWAEVKKLEGYFLDLKNNIKKLILQHQEFTMNSASQKLLQKY